MNTDERIKAIKEKYGKLKSEGKLAKRHARSSNILDSFNYEGITEILSSQMEKGKTIVPIDLKDFWTSCGVNMDFNHARDKTRRYVEIVMLKQLFPEKFSRVKGIYGTETTEVLRETFQTGKHFIMESNKLEEEAFLSIDVSDLMPKTPSK